MVIEQSWNTNNWQKKSWNCVNSHGILTIHDFASEFYQMCAFVFPNIKTFSIDLESPHFCPFSQNVGNAKF